MLAEFEGFIGIHENFADFLWNENEKILDVDLVNEYYENDDYSLDVESIFYLASFFITGSQMVEKLKNEISKTDNEKKIIEYSNFIHAIDANDDFDCYFWNIIDKNYCEIDYEYGHDRYYSCLQEKKVRLLPVQAYQVVNESAYGLFYESDDED